MLWPLFSSEGDTVTKVFGNQKRHLHVSSMALRRRIAKKSTLGAVAGPYSSPEAGKRFRGTSPASSGAVNRELKKPRMTDDDNDGKIFEDGTTDGDVGNEGLPAGPSSAGGGGGGESPAPLASVPTESSIAALDHTLWTIH